MKARFDTLLSAYGQAVARLAAGYEFDAGEREDLVQDIWLAVWLALPRFRGECSERTFVYRIAHNRAISHVDRRARAHKPAATPPDLPDAAAGPAESDEQARTLAALLRALRALPVIDRQIVQMSLDGLPQREIGEVLGIRENHVAVRLNRARKRLRELMEKPDA
jgi:RNA polymerase sigma factor (sigma-70 family)